MFCLLRWHFQHVLISERLNRSITHETMAEAQSFSGTLSMHHRAASAPKTVSLRSRESRFISANLVCLEFDCGMSFVSAACHMGSCIAAEDIPRFFFFFYPTVPCYDKMWTFATPKPVRAGESLKKTTTHFWSKRSLRRIKRFSEWRTSVPEEDWGPPEHFQSYWLFTDMISFKGR